MSKTKREWFESRKAVYFMLLIFFPVGLYGLWKNESFQHPTKILITAIIGLIVIINAFIEPLPPPPAPPVTRANPQAAGQGEQGRVLIDLAGNNPPSVTPATPVKNGRASITTTKTERTKEEWREHVADLQNILDGIEQRRRRLENGDSYKDRAQLAAWNKETQQWREEITSRVDFARIRLSPCESASFDTSSALSQIVQLGIGYIHPIDGYADKNNLREDYQLARSEISECKKSLTQ